MWKLRALIVSKADEDFDSSVDSDENNLNKLDLNKEVEEIFQSEGKKFRRDKFNFNDDKISTLVSANRSNKKVDWSLFYVKLFKHLGDEKKEKRISLKEIDLRLDSVLSKYDVKNGVIKLDKKFDLSNTGKKHQKENFISKIFDTFNTKEKRFLNPKENSQHTSVLKTSQNSQLRSSYINMIKDFEFNASNLRNSKVGTFRMNQEEILNLNKIEENMLERVSIKRNNERAGTIRIKKNKPNLIKKLVTKKSIESVTRDTYKTVIDKEEIFKNFKHDIRSYEKEAAKLKSISVENKKIKEVIDFISLDEIQDKINISTLDKNFFTKSLLVEYKIGVDFIIENINNYNNKKDKLL